MTEESKKKSNGKKNDAAQRIQDAFRLSVGGDVGWHWVEPEIVTWLLGWAYENDAALFFGYNRDKTTLIVTFYIGNVKEKYYVSGTTDVTAELRKLCNILAEVG